MDKAAPVAMAFCGKGISIEYKDYKSPLSEGDLAASHIVCEGLKASRLSYFV